MADLSITATNVAKVAGETETLTAGETITAGQTVYKDTADNNKAKLADCDDTAAKATVFGIALNGGASGQPIVVQKTGKINVGATLTVGEIYVLSGTPGGIAPEGDHATGDYVSLLGVGLTAANLGLRINNSGVQVP